jgi:Domain of unknown function (DUF932)
MSMKSNQSSNWQFTVRQLPMRHPESNIVIPNLFGNFRDDTGECLGTTSEQYGLIQNTELLSAAHDALDAKGLSGYTERTLVTGGGRRFYAEFTFADKQLAANVGDLFGYKLTLQNSFDRSRRAALTLGFLRLICKNGASTLEKEVAATRKHSSGVSVNFLADAIDKVLASGKNALGVYDDLARAAVSDEQGLNILNQLVLADALSGSLRDDIQLLWLNPRRQEDAGRNLYNLYNAVTEHLTHKVSDERFEYADKVSNGILMRLVNAARHPDRLAKLVLPVPAESVSVTVNPEPVAEAAEAGVITAEVVG